MKSSLLAFVVLAISSCAEAGVYSNTASLYGQGFLDSFSWFTGSDPTNGRVNYVSEGTAQANGMVSVIGNSVMLSADSTSVLDPSGPGRNSFRLSSYNQYTTHVAIFDIGHMPEGCGTWPAIFGANWPYGGEIDIVEGVNNQSPNRVTLHTGGGCTMPEPRSMTGYSVGDDCSVFDTNNGGCGVGCPGNSFGPGFNSVGGGWYALERSDTDINVWQWERGDGSVPNEVAYPGGSVDTDNWGPPVANFPNTQCDFPSHFGPMSIVIDLTFCGDWAGAAYSQDGCPWDCVDTVNYNPGMFSNAYFWFNGLNIYQ